MLIATDKQNNTVRETEIHINDYVITGADINREMQYHPAGTLRDAQNRAAVALSVRALLLSEADRLGVPEPTPTDGQSSDELRIRQLLDQAVTTAQPRESEARAYFDKNHQRLRTPSRYRVSHIFRPAPAHDGEARVAARNRCRRLIRLIRADPDRFERLAGRHSRCTSKDAGGSLGVVGPGQTCREFEQALDRLPVGQVAAHPLETAYGFHVVWLHARERGEPLPFEAMRPVVEDYLRESVWRRSVNQYLQILAGQARVQGINLQGAHSPLVQ